MKHIKYLLLCLCVCFVGCSNPYYTKAGVMLGVGATALGVAYLIDGEDSNETRDVVLVAFGIDPDKVGCPCDTTRGQTMKDAIRGKECRECYTRNKLARLEKEGYDTTQFTQEEINEYIEAVALGNACNVENPQCVLSSGKKIVVEFKKAKNKTYKDAFGEHRQNEL